MKKYRYVSYDKNNKKHKGVEYAENEFELVSLLYDKDEFLHHINTATIFLDTKVKLKSRELSEFCLQLGSMIQAGLSVIKALEIIKETLLCRKVVRNIYNSIYDDVKIGSSLSQAIIKVNAFPELMVNIIKASEENATLDAVLFQLADYYERDIKISSKIKGALTYPIILIIVMLVAVLVIFKLILPTFLETLQTMTELPLITQIVISISDILTKYGIIILIFTVFLITGIVYLLKIPIIKYHVDRIKLKIPYVGRLLASVYTYRFASTLSSMYLSGISVINAVMLSSNTISNKYLETQLILVAQNLEHGASLSFSLKDVVGFHKKLSASIRVGEETGELSSLLIKLSKTLEEDANSSVDRLLTLLEPLTIVILSVVILPIVLAVMLPMFKMYSSVGVGM